jgi:hypothetical protein
MHSVSVTHHQLDLPAYNKAPSSIPQPQRKNVTSAVTRPYSAAVESQRARSEPCFVPSKITARLKDNSISEHPSDIKTC